MPKLFHLPPQPVSGHACLFLGQAGNWCSTTRRRQPRNPKTSLLLWCSVVQFKRLSKSCFGMNHRAPEHQRNHLMQSGRFAVFETGRSSFAVPLRFNWNAKFRRRAQHFRKKDNGLATDGRGAKRVGHSVRVIVMPLPIHLTSGTECDSTHLGYTNIPRFVRIASKATSSIRIRYR